MNYFKELIDIYNNLNNKKISLVEQEGNTTEPSVQAIATANQHIAAAHGKASLKNAANPNNHKVFDPEFPNGIWEGKEKLVVWAMKSRNVTIEPADLTNEHFRKFALLFDENNTKGGDTKSGEVENQVIPPTPTLTLEEIKTAELWSKIESYIPELFEKMPNFTAEALAGGGGKVRSEKNAQPRGKLSYNNFMRYIRGNSPQSIENQLQNCLVLNMDVTAGNYYDLKPTGDKNLSLEVVKSYETIIRLASQDTLTDAEKNQLRGLIAVTDDERIVIFDGNNSNRGIIFSDMNGFGKGLVKSIESRLEVGINQNLIVQDRAFADAADDTLGVLLEEVACLLSLSDRKVGSNALKDHFMKKWSEKMDTILNNLEATANVWNDSNCKPPPTNSAQELHAWTTRCKDYATEFNPQVLVLEHLFKNRSENLIKSMIGMNADALRRRRPNRTIPLGKVTKRGRRADVREVYNTPEALLNAARQSGLHIDPKDVSSMSMTIEDAWGSKPENKIMRDLDVDYTKGQNVWCLDVSYKHYKTNASIKIGGCWSNTINDFHGGIDLKQDNKATTEDVKATVAFRKVISEIVGLDLNDTGTVDSKRLAAYHKEQDKVYDLINGLKLEVKVNNSKITMRSFDNFIENTLKVLKANNLYDDLWGAESGKGQDKKDLVTVLKNYGERKNSTDNQNNEIVLDIKNRLITYLQNKKLEKNMNSKDGKVKQTSREYFATKMLLAGGSNDDRLIVDSRLKGYALNRVFLQNAVFRSILSSWLKGENKYELRVDGNIFKIVNVNGELKDDFLELKDVHNKTGKSAFQSTVYPGTHTMKTHDKRLNDSKDYHKGMDNMILEYLNSQKTILTDLFKLLSKNY